MRSQLPFPSPAPTPVVTVRRQVPLCPGPDGVLPGPAAGPTQAETLAPCSESHRAEVYTAITLDHLSDLLDEVGVIARQEAVEETPLLVFHLGDHMVGLEPHGEGGAASSFTLHAAFDTQVGLEAINAFNQEARFCRAFLDEDGHAVLQGDLILQGGVTRDTILKTIGSFRDLMEDFSKSVARE